MIPPRDKVLVCIPTLDRRIDVGLLGGLLQCLHLFHHPYIWGGMSDIALARNHIAHKFVEHDTEFDWMMCIDSDIEFDISDWELLWEGDEDIVTAVYSKKVIGEPPAQFGLGFTRIHRSVFEKMKELKNPDGTEMVPRFYDKGQIHLGYYTTGPNSDARWVGEDKSFFFRASLTDATYRLETRTRLRHIGYFAYHYPEQIPDYPMLTGDGAN
jgi:hypothetical protein